MTTQIPQLAPLERALPKSQADWERLLTEFAAWRRTIQGQLWTPITLQNGWANYGGPYAPAGYYVDASGRLFCRGLIQAGTATDATVLFTLPVTPSYRLITAAFSQNGTVRLDVLASGAIEIYAATGTPWVSLDQLAFSLIP